MPNDLDFDPLGSTCPSLDLRRQLWGNIGKTAGQFARKGVVRFLGDFGSHEVVGASERVEVSDGDGMIGILNFLPGRVAEWWEIVKGLVLRIMVR